MNLWGGGGVHNSVRNREHVNFAHGKSGEVLGRVFHAFWKRPWTSENHNHALGMSSKV